MSTTDTEKTATDVGVPVTLVDGRTVHLKYTMRSLVAIEDRYGSVAAIQAMVATDEQGRPTGKALRPLVELLAFGLLHEGVGEEELLDVADLARLEEYSEAVSQAFAEAFPQAQAAEAKGNGQPTGEASP